MANLNNIANISQGLGTTQVISHQPEPNNAIVAILTRIHKVPLIPIKTKIPKAVNISQDAGRVKYN